MSKLNRRHFLQSSIAGCSLAASPWMTPIALAATPSEQRLVVIILRGGMDGLDVLRPVGDPDFAALRHSFATANRSLELDPLFALHPGLAELMPLWRAGELGFAHAVSTPYRDKRSHFEGQDYLEAGLPADQAVNATSQGWLNRLVELLPKATARTAFAVGHEQMAVLQGPAPHSVWHPDTGLSASPQMQLLLEHVYHEDPLFRDSAAVTFELLADAETGERAAKPYHRVIDYVAQQLQADTRIASFSISGWDTHRTQSTALNGPLHRLATALLRLKSQLGPIWQSTAIMAVTEFGRAARENGTKGTDHGTGSA
ncbi:MAG: DUF1501 domain-containing protein, partial [Mangrovicoccus sp.]